MRVRFLFLRLKRGMHCYNTTAVRTVWYVHKQVECLLVLSDVREDTTTVIENITNSCQSTPKHFQFVPLDILDDSM